MSAWHPPTMLSSVRLARLPVLAALACHAASIGQRVFLPIPSFATLIHINPGTAEPLPVSPPEAAAYPLKSRGTQCVAIEPPILLCSPHYCFSLWPWSPWTLKVGSPAGKSSGESTSYPQFLCRLRLSAVQPW